MRRLFLLLISLLAVPATVRAQEASTSGTVETEEAPFEVPVFLPRAAMVGMYGNQGALTPQVRLQWQHTLIQHRRDAFVAYLEGGGGAALSMPSNLLPYAVGRMTQMYQALAMVGLGYNAVYSDGWSWGFQVLTGPKWYGAKFNDIDDEAALGGTVEGRGNIGISIGSVRLMATAGWAQLWVVPRSSVAAQYVGGPIFGVYLDWRPIQRPR